MVSDLPHGSMSVLLKEATTLCDQLSDLALSTTEVHKLYQARNGRIRLGRGDEGEEERIGTALLMEEKNRPTLWS
jgi:hypothetical protein